MNLQQVIKILLCLLVLNLGIAFGAGLYEARIEGPQWLEFTATGNYVWNAQAAREANTGLRFWVFVTTIPLTLLTILSLIAVWKSERIIRKWWLLALAFILIDRTMTFGYFIPTMVKLMSGAVPSAKAAAVAKQWMDVNNIRHFATGLALLFTLKTFSVYYYQTSKPGKKAIKRKYSRR